MPDYTVEYHWVCTAQDGASVKIGKYTVTNHGPDAGGWRCTCQGFRFREDCKHVNQARQSVCHWNGFYDEGEPTVDEDSVHLCPNCGAPCKSVGFAV